MGMDIFLCKSIHISWSYEDADALLQIADEGPQEWIVTVGGKGMPRHITKKLIAEGYKKGDRVSVVMWS